MDFVHLYNKLCCVNQWSIGFSKGNIEEIIRDKNCSLTFKWLPLTDNFTSIADPFIFKDAEGKLSMLYETFSVVDKTKYGKIELVTLDNEFSIVSKTEVLDANSHSSYPFIFIENGTTYIIPETSHQGKVSIYEYDHVNKVMTNEKVIINRMPLLDSTIFKHNDKYWLFATFNKNENDYNSLYIYYADSLFGEYYPHANNPVKNTGDGSRPAGSVIKVDGELYRPAQNCSRHYGESITINKITKLSTKEFVEELHFKIEPDKTNEFNSGLHTINVLDNIIVVDGIKMVFKPVTKWKLFFKKKLRKII